MKDAITTLLEVYEAADKDVLKEQNAALADALEAVAKAREAGE